MRSYIRLGGMETQSNAVARPRLMRTQDSPDERANLVVRDLGFSSYLTKLDRAVQDDTVARRVQAWEG